MSSSMIYFNEKRSQHIDKLIYQEQKGKTWIKTSQLKTKLCVRNLRIIKVGPGSSLLLFANDLDQI